MPRQPFSTVLAGRDSSSTWGTTVIAGHPLAERIGTAIGAWSHVEVRVCWLLTSALGVHAEIVADVYGELMATGSQTAKVLEIVAQRGLAPDDYILFRAIKRIHNSRIKDRHDLAHGLWGISTALPDCLLWTHMRSDLRKTAAWETAMAQGQAPSAEDMKNEFFVYRKSDFDLIIREFKELAGYWTTLGHLASRYRLQSWKPQLRKQDDDERLALKNAPPIRLILDKPDQDR